MHVSESALWIVVLVVVVLPTALAMAGPLLVRRFFPLHILSVNNEVAGFKFATVGVIYAVLLAFAVIVVWEKFSETENDVAREAGAAAAVYRLIDGMEGDAGATLHAAVSKYLREAIEKDWPAMHHGHPSEDVTKTLDSLYTIALSYRPTDVRGGVLLGAILREIDTVTEARRARLVKAKGAMPRILWAVLVCGAVVTLGFTLFFGTENVRAQSIMTGGLSVLIFSGMLVIVVIDHPFSGAVSVGPEALVEVLQDLGTPHVAPAAR